MRVPAGVRVPDREYRVDVGGLWLGMHEWGDAADPPLFLMHGGLDFARTFDVFAPLLADAGWRVVAWDQRGHGDSDHVALYGRDADVRDALAVMDMIATGPAPLVAHSKGGALAILIGDAHPDRFSAIVNIDGVPRPRDASREIEPKRTDIFSGDIAEWLDRRRALGAGSSRQGGTIAELAARRQKVNPRLDIEWLEYLVTVGATEDERGWRWKLDPALRGGGFGPWWSNWVLSRLPGLPMPFLGIVALIHEQMGWGATLESVTPYLPERGRCLAWADSGHFMHVENPHRVADAVLDFLGPPA